MLEIEYYKESWEKVSPFRFTKSFLPFTAQKTFDRRDFNLYYSLAQITFPKVRLLVLYIGLKSSLEIYINSEPLRQGLSICQSFCVGLCQDCRFESFFERKKYPSADSLKHLL